MGWEEGGGDVINSRHQRAGAQSPGDCGPGPSDHGASDDVTSANQRPERVARDQSEGRVNEANVTFCVTLSRVRVANLL